MIELLVVIAIIAILAAILFPVFAQAKAAAKQAATLSNLKQNDLATVMYANDYDDTEFLPWQDGPWICAPTDQNCINQAGYAVQKLYPYTKSILLDWDQASPMPNFAGGTPMPQGTYWGDWTVSGTLSWSNGGITVPIDNHNPRVLSSQQHPAELMIAAACKTGADPTGCFDFTETEPSCYNPNGQRYGGSTTTATNGVGLAAENWHAKGIPSAFMDGHVKLMKGMYYSAPNNDCDAQTYQWYVGESSQGNYYTPNNDWSSFYLTPRVLNYWGTWWDASQ